MEIQYRLSLTDENNFEVRIKGGLVPNNQKWKEYTQEEAWKFMIELNKQTEWPIVFIS